VGLCALSGMLYWFPPAQYPFYPSCPFFACTGLLCPGCGATRALAALLHGHLHEALQWNALFVLVIVPLALVYSVAALRKGRWVRMPLPAVYAFGAIAIAFGVERNF
jgi:hypothetical protein